jgi:hypothetical protein
VSVLLARGRVEWCGADPGGEPVAVGEAGDVTRSNAGQQRLGPTGGDVAFRLPRQEFYQQCLEPVDGLDPATDECFAAVGEHPQRLELTVELEHPQGLGADRDCGD